jgi:hypothetical protein
MTTHNFVRSLTIASALTASLAFVDPAAAQSPTPPPTETPEASAPAEDPKATPPADLGWLKDREITMQHFRPLDRRGINMFETPKEPGAEYTGFKLDWGAAFTSQVQDLSHSNTALPNVVGGVNQNQLADIGFWFNNSTANLYLNAQLARGIRVQLTSYLSSRHHNETWVKDGFLLVDASPIDLKPLNKLMEKVTLRMGHFEINYGDAHFRRTDNGQAMYNPFIGNLIMDAFTTEVGGEAYLRHKGFLAMASLTGGEVRGTVLSPGKRSPSVIGKLGFDRQVQENLRVRLTGSLYRNNNSLSNTLYGGDRAGSRYYYVVENVAATESAQFTSGMINPGFRNEVTAVQINPFVKYGGLEVFGVFERAEGKASAVSGSPRSVRVARPRRRRRTCPFPDGTAPWRCTADTHGTRGASGRRHREWRGSLPRTRCSGRCARTRSAPTARARRRRHTCRSHGGTARARCTDDTPRTRATYARRRRESEGSPRS